MGLIKMEKIGNFKEIKDVFISKRFEFLENEPFPNYSFKNLISEDFLNDVLNNFPTLEQLSWYKYDNVFEKKYLFTDREKLGGNINLLFDFLNSDEFLNCLEALTGIDNLISDKTLYGGGLHQVKSGGKLDIHADFNRHKIFNWHRRVNLILYLNREWKRAYGGFLELWDRDVTHAVAKISPSFNVMSIFKTDEFSFHGHPDPLVCPEDITRKSIALYYYTEAPRESTIASHSTCYVKRPQDETNEEIEELRVKRSGKRLEDLKS
jgi:Rps23 Pro-64 3,4-dihydroxylase Tpa1-like proline 4-hydroxylase